MIHGFFVHVIESFLGTGFGVANHGKRMDAFLFHQGGKGAIVKLSIVGLWLCILGRVLFEFKFKEVKHVHDDDNG